MPTSIKAMAQNVNQKTQEYNGQYLPDAFSYHSRRDFKQLPSVILKR